MLLLFLRLITVTLPLQLGCHCPSSVPLSVASYWPVQMKLKFLCALCSLLAASEPAWLPDRLNGWTHMHHTCQQPRWTSRHLFQSGNIQLFPPMGGQTGSVKSPTEGGADLGFVRLLVRLWSPSALKIVFFVHSVCLCLHVDKELLAKDFSGKKT